MVVFSNLTQGMKADRAVERGRPHPRVSLKSFTSGPRLVYSGALIPKPCPAGRVLRQMRCAMPLLSRRSLLSSGLALSASSMLARSAWGRAAGLMNDAGPGTSEEDVRAVGPRERLLFDFGWKFTF